MSAEIESASAALADARLKAEEANGAGADARAAVDEVKGRIAELESERSKIISDRKAGKVAKDHGAKLAEIQADVDGLNEILAERQTASTAAAGEATRLSQVATAAAWVLTTATDDALLTGLKSTADDLAERLQATIDGIAVVAKRLGHSRSAWLPSATLANSIRRLDLEHGERP